MKIPLFTPTDIPDASHQVTAPGGYECWNFHARNATGDLLIAMSFSQGFPEHPGYLRAYRRFRQQPTRRTPPRPADYPCVCFSLYQNDRCVADFIAHFPADQLAATTDQTEVRCGPNLFVKEPGGSLLVEIRHRALSATFRFTPKRSGSPLEQVIFPRGWSGADHRWVISNPLCEVTGEIRLDLTAPSPLQFDGPGSHDHSFGLAPIGRGLNRWLRGHILMDNHTIFVHLARPTNNAIDCQMIESEPMGTRVLSLEQVQLDWNGRTGMQLRYPEHIQGGPVQLHSPRVLRSTLHSVRLVYRASIRGNHGEAFCEIIYPHRLRWPIPARFVLGHVIEKPTVQP
jgi:hypothetical protein